MRISDWSSDVCSSDLNELKEQIIDELLPTALATTKYIPFYIWDDRLVVESTSGSSVDIVVGLLAKCIDPFPVEALHLNQSPAGSMTTWLVDDEAPEGFTIDNEVDMKSRSETGARRSEERSVGKERVSRGGSRW